MSETELLKRCAKIARETYKLDAKVSSFYGDKVIKITLEPFADCTNTYNDWLNHVSELGLTEQSVRALPSMKPIFDKLASSDAYLKQNANKVWVLHDGDSKRETVIIDDYFQAFANSGIFPIRDGLKIVNFFNKKS